MATSSQIIINFVSITKNPLFHKGADRFFCKKKERQSLSFLESQLLFDLGTLAHAAAQIIELCPADLTIANHLNVVNGRRVNRENLLHAHAIGNAADGDGLLLSLIHI